MGIDQRFEQITVLGAAGKMGSGISLLLAQEIVRLKNIPENQKKSYQLNLIDVRQEGLDGALNYVRTQCTRKAESNVDRLRTLYDDREDLKTDEQIVKAFVDDALSVICTHTDIHQAADSRLVFEVVPEDEQLKIDTLRTVGDICPGSYFFSNTSSIPIGFLDQEAGLGGRLIGSHFFNPPAVQKLLELIPSSATRPELTEMARDLGRRLGKTVVFSGDVAGFIGTGHFVREALYALDQAGNLRDRSRCARRDLRVKQDQPGRTDPSDGNVSAPRLYRAGRHFVSPASDGKAHRQGNIPLRSDRPDELEKADGRAASRWIAERRVLPIRRATSGWHLHF